MLFLKGSESGGPNFLTGNGGLWGIPAGIRCWSLRTSSFEKYPHTLEDRTVVPCGLMDGCRPYLYLFNYSVAPELKGGIISKRLVKSLSEDVKAQLSAGLACITVSDDGVRIAKRLAWSMPAISFWMAV